MRYTAPVFGRIWKQFILVVALVGAAGVTGAVVAADLIGLARLAAEQPVSLNDAQRLLLRLADRPAWQPAALTVFLALCLLYVARTPAPPRTGGRRVAPTLRLDPPGLDAQTAAPRMRGVRPGPLENPFDDALDDAPAATPARSARRGSGQGTLSLGAPEAVAPRLGVPGRAVEEDEEAAPPPRAPSRAAVPEDRFDRPGPGLRVVPVAEPPPPPAPPPRVRLQRAPLPVPDDAVSFRALLERAGRWQGERRPGEERTSQQVARRLYEALQDARLAAWGHASPVYPPDTDAPPPPAWIDASFWDDHLIEEVEMLGGRTAMMVRVGKRRWDSITLARPGVFAGREIAPCYWNLLFDREGCAQAFPLDRE